MPFKTKIDRYKCYSTGGDPELMLLSSSVDVCWEGRVVGVLSYEETLKLVEKNLQPLLGNYILNYLRI